MTCQARAEERNVNGLLIRSECKNTFISSSVLNIANQLSGSTSGSRKIRTAKKSAQKPPSTVITRDEGVQTEEWKEAEPSTESQEAQLPKEALDLLADGTLSTTALFNAVFNLTICTVYGVVNYH